MTAPHHRKPNRRPPLTTCQECGAQHHSWRPGALCNACVRSRRDLPPLNLRELRKRLQAIDAEHAARRNSDPPTAA